MGRGRTRTRCMRSGTRRWASSSGSRRGRATTVLDRDGTYRLLRHLGLCAKAIGRAEPDPLYRLYWNQTRMGGRTASELARGVTLQDAYEAIGIDDVEDADAVAALAALE